MTRRDLDKLLDHCGVGPDGFIDVFLAENAINLGEISPGDVFRLEPHAKLLARDYWVIEMRQK
jgi:hypothetical protein